MSDSCPENVCTQFPVLMSHTFAVESHAPDTKMFLSGEREMAMTSPVWSAKSIAFTPVSMSHNLQVVSPDEERIWLSLRNRQQDKYPLWPSSSFDTLMPPIFY